MFLNDNTRILIFSDSHGNINNMIKVIEKEKPFQYLFHLGDIVLDVIQLMDRYKDIKIHYVTGNHDGFSSEPKEMILDILGWRIFLTHGHVYDVKNSMDMIIQRAEDIKADIVIYGHNHFQKCINHNNILFINPGSISDPEELDDLNFSYSVLELNKHEAIVKSYWQPAESSDDIVGLKLGTARLMPHNPEWKDMYLKEKKLVLSVIGSKVLDMQHIGSTSVPGLKAKPVIDMVVGVKSLDDTFDLIDDLASIGYAFKGESGVPGRNFFVKTINKIRTHQIHVTEINSYRWFRFTLFRDYLCNNPDALKQYQEIKESMSAKFYNNKKAYSDGKISFIDDIVDKLVEEKLAEINK